MLFRCAKSVNGAWGRWQNPNTDFFWIRSNVVVLFGEDKQIEYFHYALKWSCVVVLRNRCMDLVAIVSASIFLNIYHK